MTVPSSVDHRVVRLADGHLAGRGEQGIVECCSGFRPLEPEFTHMSKVEEPGGGAHRLMFLEDTRVLDRHFPPGIGNHPGTEGTVTTIKGSLVHGSSPLHKA